MSKLKHHTWMEVAIGDEMHKKKKYIRITNLLLAFFRDVNHRSYEIDQQLQRCGTWN